MIKAEVENKANKQNKTKENKVWVQDESHGLTNGK